VCLLQAAARVPAAGCCSCACCRLLLRCQASRGVPSVNPRSPHMSSSLTASLEQLDAATHGCSLRLKLNSYPPLQWFRRRSVSVSSLAALVFLRLRPLLYLPTMRRAWLILIGWHMRSSLLQADNETCIAWLEGSVVAVTVPSLVLLMILRVHPADAAGPGREFESIQTLNESLNLPTLNRFVSLGGQRSD
jgi:hypothetical protein